jgi:hypothetical protein
LEGEEQTGDHHRFAQGRKEGKNAAKKRSAKK